MSDSVSLVKECWLNKEPFHQCCCTCLLHWEDVTHCQEDKKFIETAYPNHKGCGCGLNKGWLCLFVAQDGERKAISGWPKHSIGCELHITKKEGGK